MKTEVAIALAAELLRQAISISQLINQAQSQGRTELTREEMDAVMARDDEARAALLAALGR